MFLLFLALMIKYNHSFTEIFLYNFSSSLWLHILCLGFWTIWNLLWHKVGSCEILVVPSNLKNSAVSSLILIPCIFFILSLASLFHFKEMWICSMTLEWSKLYLYRNPRHCPRHQRLWLDLPLWQLAPFDPFAKICCCHMDLLPSGYPWRSEQSPVSRFCHRSPCLCSLR